METNNQTDQLTPIVVFMRLTTGEELVTLMRKNKGPDGTDTIELNIPVLAVMNEEAKTFRFRPWLFIEENTNKDAWIVINPLSIIACGTPTKDLVATYNDMRQQLCSPLTIPTEEDKIQFSKKTDSPLIMNSVKE